VLALWPLRDVITGVPVVSTMTGHSGAGRSRGTTEFLFAEGANDARAYVPVGHRHTPEMEQALGIPVRFTPHMVPMPRGMYATVQVPVSTGSELETLFRRAYREEPFVRLSTRIPTSKATLGSNRCDIHVRYDERTGHAVILSALDNLMKGASGAALQNMNLMLGLPETAGLPRDGIWP
ncbi:MAG: N-acetyl-gamma-glutamyl-phosphate reductase, partial [Armatimonadota bacterium]